MRRTTTTMISQKEFCKTVTLICSPFHFLFDSPFCLALQFTLSRTKRTTYFNLSSIRANTTLFLAKGHLLLLFLLRRLVSFCPEVQAKEVRRGRPRNLPHPTPAASPEMGDADSGPVITRSGATDGNENWCWESVLCSDPEMLLRQASRHSENEDESELAAQHRIADEARQAESLRNPTSAMREIIKRMEDREKERQHMTWQQQLHHLTKNKGNGGGGGNAKVTWDLTPNPLTPAMEEVIQMRSKRVSFDYDVPITPEPSDSEDEERTGDGEEDAASDASSHEEFEPVASTSKRTPASTPVSKKQHASPPPPPTSGSHPRRSSPTRQMTPRGFNSFIQSELAGGEDVELDEALLKVLKEEGISVEQQRQLYRTVVTKKSSSSRASTSRALFVNGFEESANGGMSDFTTSSSDDAEESGDDAINSRRISIQNEVSPIRNKDSPPDPDPTKSAVAVDVEETPFLKSLSQQNSPPVLSSLLKGKRAPEKWVVCAAAAGSDAKKRHFSSPKRISSIPVGSFVETAKAPSYAASYSAPVVSPAKLDESIYDFHDETDDIPLPPIRSPFKNRPPQQQQRPKVEEEPAAVDEPTEVEPAMKGEEEKGAKATCEEEKDDDDDDDDPALPPSPVKTRAQTQPPAKRTRANTSASDKSSGSSGSSCKSGPTRRLLPVSKTYSRAKRPSTELEEEAEEEEPLPSPPPARKARLTKSKRNKRKRAAARRGKPVRAATEEDEEERWAVAPASDDDEEEEEEGEKPAAKKRKTAPHHHAAAPPPPPPRRKVLARGWSWEQVMHTNPEKILKRKK